MREGNNDMTGETNGHPLLCNAEQIKTVIFQTLNLVAQPHMWLNDGGEPLIEGISELDRELHTLYVAQLIADWAKGKITTVRAALIDEYGLSNAIDQLPYDQRTTLADGSVYTFTLTKRYPASRLDARELLVQLRRLGVKNELIEQAERQSMRECRPPQTFAVEMREQSHD